MTAACRAAMRTARGSEDTAGVESVVGLGCVGGEDGVYDGDGADMDREREPQRCEHGGDAVAAAGGAAGFEVAEPLHRDAGSAGDVGLGEPEAATVVAQCACEAPRCADVEVEEFGGCRIGHGTGVRDEQQFFAVFRYYSY